MHIRLLIVMLGALLLADRAEAQFRVANPAPGENFTVEVGLMLWTPSPELMFQTGALAALPSSDVDFVREFAIESDRFRDFRSVIKLARKHKLRFSQVRMKYDEQAILQRMLSFGGITIPVSVPASAQLEWNLWRLGYEWDFVAADRGFLGLVTEVKTNKMTAVVSAEGYGSESTEVSAPVANVGLIMRAYPHRNFAITTEFTGFNIPGFIGNRIKNAVNSDFEAKMFEVDLYGTLNFGRHVGLQFGYRKVSVEYAVDDDSGTAKMGGGYFGGLLRF
jgi:hypothetical protein